MTNHMTFAQFSSVDPTEGGAHPWFSAMHAGAGPYRERSEAPHRFV